MSDNTSNTNQNADEPNIDGNPEQTDSIGQTSADAQASVPAEQEAVFKAADPAPHIQPKPSAADGETSRPQAQHAPTAVDQRAYEQYQVLAATVL